MHFHETGSSWSQSSWSLNPTTWGSNLNITQLFHGQIFNIINCIQKMVKVIFNLTRHRNSFLIPCDSLKRVNLAQCKYSHHRDLPFLLLLSKCYETFLRKCYSTFLRKWYFMLINSAERSTEYFIQAKFNVINNISAVSAIFVRKC